MVPECASAWRCPRCRKTKTFLPVFPNVNLVAIVEVVVKSSVPRKAISGAHLIIEDHTSFRQSLTLDGESGFEVMAQKGVLAKRL